eukprot:s5602_g2.t1
MHFLCAEQAPLHDAFANWGYPFEKRKKTGFAAKANLVSDPTSYLWRYHALPPAACGPHSGTPGGVSICLPEPSTEGRRRATDAAILLVFLRVRARLRCAGVPSTISPTELQGNTSSWLLEAIRCSQDVQCMDNRTPTADTLRCGHYGAWVGQLHCLEEDDVLPTLWAADGPRPPTVIDRAHS